MAETKGTFIICIVLYLNLQIQAYTVTKEYAGRYTNEAGIITLVAESKGRLFSIGFENDTIIMVAIDGGKDSYICWVPARTIDNYSANKIASTLGNGKIVMSAHVGKVEHLRGPVCSYVVIDPLDCSGLVEFKSFCGRIVPYYDSFEIVFWNWRQRNDDLKPHRYTDKGRLIKLKNPIVQKIGSDTFDVTTIRPFDPSGGYFYWARETLGHEATIEYLDSGMEMNQWVNVAYQSRESTSMDHGRVTHCYSNYEVSDYQHVCKFMNIYLQDQMNVTLPQLNKSRIHTVTNLPFGDVVVVREIEDSKESNFYVNIIRADGSVLDSELIMTHDTYVFEGKGFVLSDSGEFCLVSNGKGSKSRSPEERKLNELVIHTKCIDVLQYTDSVFRSLLKVSRAEETSMLP
ncbi:uncharacterized protein LOC107982118 isoform X1 [Nasonia vitripennis]|uniref:Uncharacterized protein n=1 Tax=Nasonia vitripennis TaxID=7425 RepID=A0A7M7IV24_NASVI|nr:uncharacterized protein LOC107982118 isoform X1 [Nasonia vitripennis]XP_031777579.1 uncharacterized protein LOC107982118 isoform X1 [Nasonia vitripennis]